MLFEKLGNPILNTDAYKTSHFLQLPPGARQMSAYIESRGGKYDEVVSFGMQAFVKEYLTKPITREFIDDGLKYIAQRMNLPYNKEGWEYILEKYDGYLPLEIETVAEGSVIPTHHVTSQLINTDPNCAWLPGYIEDMILRATWYMNTVATKSYHCKQIIKKHMEKSCDNLGKLPYMLNDFGARAATSTESAALGGLAHLVNFSGTDTIMATVAGDLYYAYEAEYQGVPAAEHSTITSWGKDGETDAYRNMIKQFAGNGKIVAVVSDSYDLYNAIENIWGGTLKDDVINNGGTIVIRPDSGDPVDVVCKSLELLEKQFGTTMNDAQYKVLPPYIRLIQGDGVNPEAIDAILTAMEEKGYSADNICFGMGGELLQKLDRDTQKYAMKANAIRMADMEADFQDFMREREVQNAVANDNRMDLAQQALQETGGSLLHSTEGLVYRVKGRAVTFDEFMKDDSLSAFDVEGTWRDVFKDPVTDPGKMSKPGIRALVFDENKGYITCRRDELDGRENLLQQIYRNGRLTREVTMNQVRQTAEETGAKLNAFKEKQAAQKMDLVA